MATYDYGQLTELDPYADYEWHGTHVYNSALHLALDVDVLDPEQGSRAVNARTMAGYVAAQLAAAGSGETSTADTGPTSTWDFQGAVAFSGQSRVEFRLSPILTERLSLWDITGLADWPDQSQLFTPATLGDTKDYVDQNVEMIVTYVTGLIGDATGAALSQQLPNLVADVLAAQLPPLQDQYAGDVLLPEVDRRIESAVRYLGGVTSEQVQSEILVQLPAMIQQYSQAELVPLLTELVAGLSGESLAALELRITESYTAAIGAALEAYTAGGSGWSREAIVAIAEEVVARVAGDERLLALVESVVSARLPDAVADAVAAQLPLQLPGALTTETVWALVKDPSLVQAAEEVARQLAEQEDRLVESTIGTVLPRVQEEMAGFVRTAVQAELAATLPSSVEASVAEALQASLGDFLGEGGTLEELISTRVPAAVSGYFDTVITPGLEARIQGLVDETLPALVGTQVDTQVQQALAVLVAEDLPALVQDATQTIVQPALDTLVATTVPNVVNLQLAETVPGMVADQLDARLGDARVPVYKRFEVTQPSTLWVITHNMNTVTFFERLYNSSGRAMHALVEPVDETSFIVRLTEATSGWVDVEFFQ